MSEQGKWTSGHDPGDEAPEWQSTDWWHVIAAIEERIAATPPGAWVPHLAPSDLTRLIAIVRYQTEELDALRTTLPEVRAELAEARKQASRSANLASSLAAAAVASGDQARADLAEARRALAAAERDRNLDRLMARNSRQQADADVERVERILSCEREMTRAVKAERDAARAQVAMLRAALCQADRGLTRRLADLEGVGVPVGDTEWALTVLRDAVRAALAASEPGEGE